MRFFKKNPIIAVVALVLVAVLAVGGVSRITNIAATPFSFTQGSLNANGGYVESKASIFTEGLISCEDLTITPDFKFDGTYRVVFYDDDEKFIAATVEKTGKFVVEDKLLDVGGEYAGATQCRIVITPKNDNKISNAEVLKYAAALSISYAD